MASASELVYPGKADPDKDVLPALREYLVIHPEDTTNEAVDIAWALYNLNFLDHQPSEAEVVAALEALRVEGEVLA
jgi:hypothetical protein